MNTRRCFDIARSVPAAAAVSVLLCSGCAKPTIKIETQPVYQETLEEVEEETPNMKTETSDDAAVRIKFDDLQLNLQPDTLFEDRMLTDAVKQLTGKRVSLTGVMLDPGSFKPTDEFILLRNKERHGKGQSADHLVSVQLRSGETTKYSASTVRATGKLNIEPFTGDDGVTRLIYVLKDATVAVE